MKYYTFKRESNEFNDILKDENLKKYIDTKIRWNNNIMIGFNDRIPESVFGYMVLKYGDDIVNAIAKDFTPIPGKDYLPAR